MSYLIASYPESNQNTLTNPSGAGVSGIGQSFFNDGNARIEKAVWYLKAATPRTGGAVAKIYNVTGSSGSYVPTGSALAESNPFDVSLLTTSFQLIDFEFTGADRIVLQPSTRYVLTMETTSSGSFELGQANPGTYANENSCSYFTSWTSSSRDCIFYLYGIPASISNIASMTNVTSITL